jgi:serine/threonine-protein kinase RsbW
MPDDAHISIRVLSEPRYLSTVRAAVSEAATRAGFPEETVGKIALAIDEAMTNVIRHGYKGRKDQPIWLKITPVHEGDHAGLEFVIEDACPETDLSKIKGRPLEEVRPGGLGVHIITGVMDQVEYAHRADGGGLRLKMVKWLNAATPAK